tara:strand:+ start:284 stop:1357 length:1074 start_codon:yes stop_codon:yes gene_type:complete
MPRLLIAASGTGGHLFPALALADALPQIWGVTWLGVPDRMETKILPSHYRLKTLKVGGLQSKGLKKILELFRLILATQRVCYLIKEQKIHVIFTTGGYIAAPTILAALWSKTPIVLHESNVFPGKVTRILGRFCNIVALGFSPAEKHLRGCRTVLTGTPVRKEFMIYQSLPDWVPTGKGPLIVALGGSQGAVGLNLMIRGVIPSLLQRGCRIVHITGENDPCTGRYSHPNYVERIFTHHIPALLQNADLAISRSGAGTICELLACKCPSILIPFPFSADKHQDWNASYAAEYGAAIILQESKSNFEPLEQSIQRLLRYKSTQNHSLFDCLGDMRKNINQLSIETGETSLIKILEDII